MRHLVVISTLVFLICARAALAETMEILLPQLNGPYSVDGIQVRRASFQMERLPRTVRSVTMRLVGYHLGGEMGCDAGMCAPYGICLWWFEFKVVMNDSTTGGYWMASHTPQPFVGQFEMELVPVAYGSATWDFLNSGMGDIDLHGRPSEINNYQCWPVFYPEAAVDTATLIIEGDFYVAVQSNSWGCIKALFSR
jgi:hypothetical protein